MIIVGIDPGASGGVAVKYPDSPILCTPMPTNHEGDLCDFLRGIKIGADTENVRLKVYIEHVTGFVGGPNRGAHMFTFGGCYSYAFGVCHALKIQLIKVQPEAWQEHFDFPKKMGYDERKKYAVIEANRRLPDAVRVINDTADAALICEYGSQISR